jgi:hypothetical protein
MNNPTLRSLVLACGGALLALWPLGASPQASEPEGKPDLQVAALREALEAAGYAVGAPMASVEGALVVEARAPDGLHVVRAFVFTDRQAATAAHRQAYAQQQLVNGSVPDSNDTGPQLLSGYGASAWRRNVALAQSSPHIFGQLMPAEVDCGDLTPPPRPDLSRPAYRVDPDIVALLDELS